MMKLKSLNGAKTYHEAHAMMKAGYMKPTELCEATIKSLKTNEFLNCYVNFADFDQMRREAEASEKRYKEGINTNSQSY